VSDVHTRGPWSLSAEYGAHVIRGCPDGPYEFAEFVATTWGGPHDANARLIAAAPDLLEALEFALRDMEATRAQYASHAPNVGVLAASIGKARAAIAKATGEQA
jgi:hypothetical protein